MIFDLVNGFALPPVSGLLWAALTVRLNLPIWPGHSFRWYFWLYTGAPCITMLLFGQHHPWGIPGEAFWLVLAIWHLNRKRRDRAKAWLGTKSRALRDALVRKARELSQPRPVLRPVPVR